MTALNNANFIYFRFTGLIFEATISFNACIKFVWLIAKDT